MSITFDDEEEAYEYAKNSQAEGLHTVVKRNGKWIVDKYKGQPGAQCYFCKEDGIVSTEGVTKYLGRYLCPEHKQSAKEGFEEGMDEQPEFIQNLYNQSTKYKSN